MVGRRMVSEMARVLIVLKMGSDMRANGKMDKCTEKAPTMSMMVANTLATSTVILEQATASTMMQMAASMKANLLTLNATAKEPSPMRKA